MTGKTNDTLRKIYKAVKSGRKALIFDATDEFGSYLYRPGEPPHSIKPIYLEHVARFTVSRIPEVVRIRPFWDDSTRMGTDDLQQALTQVLNTYRNGILLVEDINKFIGDQTPKDIIGSLATVRQAGIDLIAHFQLMGKAANPKMLGMANYIRIHKTNDSADMYKDRFADKTEVLMIAQKIVDRRYFYGMKNSIKDETGMFFNVTYDLEYNKIRGIFNRKEVELAIAELLSDNQIVRKTMNRVDRNGNKIYSSYNEAYSVIEQRVMDEYFDFK
jgi:hypothetical protein